MNPKIIKKLFTISISTFASSLLAFVILNIIGISQKWIDAYGTLLIIEFAITTIFTLIYLIAVKD